ncbi:MAG: ATP-dependent zinc metalloprotease FtsH [Planctomycetia bacterium]|nr:ATP-dependent zinc metalloprotease FtsH [Planctomycetia bacterium]
MLQHPAEYWSAAPLINAPKNETEQDGYELVFNATGKRTGKLIYKRFHCEVPVFAFEDQKLDEKIQKHVNSYTSTTPSDNSGIFMLISILISVIIFVAIFRMMRRTNEQMMGGGFGAFNRSPAKRYDPSNQPITFADVAGLDNVKSELVEIVDFLKNPAKYERMGARVPKGTLLFGPPGTGKTLLGRAVAGEAGVPFFSINGSEFIQMFVGVGASRVRDLFNAAKENAPAILFIDEIDAVGRLRGTGVGGGHDEREQTLNQILSEMDGFSQNESVMVMAATNRPDVLDPALMRPGRFDRHITVDRPSLKGRIDIFNVYLNKIPKADDVNVEKLAKSTVGFTGADIRNLVNEATLWATRNNKNLVYMEDFEFAHEKVVMGLKREEVISEEDKRKTAYHEAGHTILGWFSEINSKVFKVTIIPRGRSLGATYFFPDEDQVNINQKQIEGMLIRFLGGRAAEKIVYQETSAGAENDLKEATQLARRMVIHWGMSEKLGPIAFRAAEASPFLGREMSEFREYSEATAQLIDEEIVRIMRQADEKANAMLTEKRDLLEKLTDVLVDEEELDQTRIAEILGPAV